MAGRSDRIRAQLAPPAERLQGHSVGCKRRRKVFRGGGCLVVHQRAIAIRGSASSVRDAFDPSENDAQQVSL